MTKQFQEIDYSGDIGIEAWGATRAQLLENATRGLFSLMTYSDVAATSRRAIHVVTDGSESLVADWLSEVITTAATLGEVYGEVHVRSCDEREASGEVIGEKVNPEKHAMRFDVKAATYHDMLLEESEGMWHSRVILDL